MELSISRFLPDELPLGAINTTDSITYEVTPDGIGNDVAQTRYTLEKAPVKRVNTVIARVNGTQGELIEGVDWELQDDKAIVFLNGGSRPDANTTFTVQYTAKSVLSRFIKSIEEESDSSKDKLGAQVSPSPEDDTVVTSKYIDTATDRELDELGKLFGELGRRAGRDTDKYRTYLKGVARVYDGRGTRESLAEAAAIVVSSDDVSISTQEISFREDFFRNEYGLEFDSFERHRPNLLYDIIEIADPAGVKFIGPIYNVDPDGVKSVEGPNVSVDNYERFDTQDDVPSDFINPLGQKIRTLDQQLQFETEVQSEKNLAKEFNWAEQKIIGPERESAGSWNQFQWGEQNWSSSVLTEFELVGPKWDFAQWITVESQGTVTLLTRNRQTTHST
jgi:hypothetical protein